MRRESGNGRISWVERNVATNNVDVVLPASDDTVSAACAISSKLALTLWKNASQSGFGTGASLPRSSSLAASRYSRRRTCRLMAGWVAFISFAAAPLDPTRTASKARRDLKIGNRRFMDRPPPHPDRFLGGAKYFDWIGTGHGAQCTRWRKDGERRP